ncbi:MAG: DUF3786 domain-containing protein [Pseudomonadota bacterium]
MQPGIKNNFDKAYDEAFTLACQRLLEKGLQSCAENTGAKVEQLTAEHSLITLAFLNKTISITLPEFIFSSDVLQDIGIWDKILILHYLCNGVASPLQQNLINFKQLSSGSTYYPSFENRCLKPFIRYYSQNTVLVIEYLLKHLGGEEVSMGDWAIKLQAFPSVPIIFVTWKADEEFPAEANILFDASIERFLSTEDIVVLCQQIVIGIIKSLKK